MSLIRYKPVPSDRMAAMWTLAQVQDAVILDYGPYGTTIFTKRKIGNMGVDTGGIVSTHLAEQDIIMGDVTALENALRTIDQERRPPLIIVVPSTILLATGADIPGVCHYMREELDAELLCYGGQNSDGDYTKGLRASYTLLLQRLCGKRSDPVPLSCNLLGLSAHTASSQRDGEEISSLMQRAFGAKTILSLGMPCRVSDFRDAGRAAVNIVLRGEALDAAQWMEAEFGTPYVYLPPYGYAGTERFLSAVGEKLGISPDRALMEELRSRAAQSAALRRTKPLFLLGDYDLAAGLIGFAGDLGIPVAGAYCEHEPFPDEPTPENVFFCEKERDWLDPLKAQHGVLIVGDERIGYAAPKDNELWIVSSGELAPRDADRGPLMGLSGADRFIQRYDGTRR